MNTKKRYRLALFAAFFSVTQIFAQDTNNDAQFKRSPADEKKEQIPKIPETVHKIIIAPGQSDKSIHVQLYEYNHENGAHNNIAHMDLPMSICQFLTHKDEAVGSSLLDHALQKEGQAHITIEFNNFSQRPDLSNCSLTNVGSNQNLTLNLNPDDIPSKSNFTLCSMQSCNLTGAHVSGVSFKHADLSKAQLQGLSARSSASFDFANLQNSNASPHQNRPTVLNGSSFKGIQAQQSNFYKAQLAHAQLHGAQFQQANLTETNLQDADCTGGNFSQANLSDTNFTGTNINGAIFDKATYTPGKPPIGLPKQIINKLNK